MFQWWGWFIYCKARGNNERYDLKIQPRLLSIQANLVYIKRIRSCCSRYLAWNNISFQTLSAKCSLWEWSCMSGTNFLVLFLSILKDYISVRLLLTWFQAKPHSLEIETSTSNIYPFIIHSCIKNSYPKSDSNRNPCENPPWSHLGLKWKYTRDKHLAESSFFKSNQIELDP